MEEIDIPRLGPTDVLCKVRRVGVCGTDYAIYSGEFSFVKNGAIKFPMTLGHEWSAVVADTGCDVKDFACGDRVVGDTGVSCGQCTYCLLGDYYNCSRIRAVGTVNAWDGAYAEYIVMPARHLFHLPDSVSFDQGAIIEPAATSLYAVTRGDVNIGDTVLVHGTGPLGILAAKLCSLKGASKVFITGRKKFKLDSALNYGADFVIDTMSQNVRDVVMDNTNGKGVDRIIETSGSTKLFAESFDYIRSGGTISVVAFYEKVLEQFDIDKFVFGNITLRAVAGSLGMYPMIISLMAAGKLDTAPLITGRYDFENIKQALDDMKSNNDARIKWMVEFAD